MAIDNFGRSGGDTNTSTTQLLVSTARYEHAVRLSKYRREWKFYNGKHWNNERLNDEEYVTANFCRTFVDTHSEFLFKEGFTITIPDDESTEENETREKEFIRIALERVWDQNNKKRMGLNMGQSGGVNGDVYIKVGWRNDDPFEDPYPGMDVLPTDLVFPDFGGPIGVDRRVMNSVLIVYPRFIQKRQHKGGTPDVEQDINLYVERWFTDRVEIYKDINTEIPVIKVNPFGVIPVVHIPNFPVVGKFYGISDLAGLIDLQCQLNDKMTNISDVIKYHGKPQVVFRGAKIDKNLERGADKIWTIPVDADVFNLSLNGELNPSLTYLNLIKGYMHQIGRIPEGVLGKVQKSVEESASSKAMQLLPMTNVREVKKVTYGRGIQELNRLIMMILDLKDDKFHNEFSKLPKSREKYKTVINFGEALKRDESIGLSNSKLKLDMGITSKEREMRELGLSKAEIADITKSNDEDKDKEMDREMISGLGFSDSGEEPKEDTQENRSGNPSPVRPNPESQGEKLSQTKDKAK